MTSRHLTIAGLMLAAQACRPAPPHSPQKIPPVATEGEAKPTEPPQDPAGAEPESPEQPEQTGN
ncbi:MAG TPA: hypothetical protein VM686_14805 [Polyangiaceae bacterium]|nr:hypothetical protein [Polyangiaceae bacterium]